jgi:hypothetical protein
VLNKGFQKKNSSRSPGWKTKSFIPRFCFLSTTCVFTYIFHCAEMLLKIFEMSVIVGSGACFGGKRFDISFISFL